MSGAVRQSQALLAKYVRMALDHGATEAKVIPARFIVTAEWVRLKCQFGCSGYNKRLCCPPYSPTPQKTRQVISEYQQAIIYAYPGSEDQRERQRMSRLLVAIERQAFLDGYYKALGLGAGPCRFCVRCDTSRRCRFPELARPSLEACGVDVYATCRNAGIELRVVRNRQEVPKYVSVVLVE
ncbi:MAG: DUF2284 domain-containing protein [candidate division WOR-3 bacterium]